MFNRALTTISGYAKLLYAHLESEAALLELLAFLTRNQSTIYLDIRFAQLPCHYLLEQHIDTVSSSSSSSGTKLRELQPDQYFDVYPIEYEDTGLFAVGKKVYRLGDMRTLDDYYIRIDRYSFDRASDGTYQLLFNVFCLNAGRAVFYDYEDPGIRPISVPLSACLLEDVPSVSISHNKEQLSKPDKVPIWSQRYEVVVDWLLTEAMRITGEPYSLASLQDAYDLCCMEHNLTKSALWQIMQSQDKRLFAGSGADFFKAKTNPPQINFKLGRPQK